MRGLDVRLHAARVAAHHPDPDTDRAQVLQGITGTALSGEATATVRIVPDPTFDCTDVTGKVFDDIDRDGVQDEGEGGLAGVRLVTPRGLRATTDIALAGPCDLIVIATKASGVGREGGEEAHGDVEGHGEALAHDLVPEPGLETAQVLGQAHTYVQVAMIHRTQLDGDVVDWMGQGCQGGWRVHGAMTAGPADDRRSLG